MQKSYFFVIFDLDIKLYLFFMKNIDEVQKRVEDSKLFSNVKVDEGKLLFLSNDGNYRFVLVREFINELSTKTEWELYWQRWNWKYRKWDTPCCIDDTRTGKMSNTLWEEINKIRWWLMMDIDDDKPKISPTINTDKGLW